MKNIVLGNYIICINMIEAIINKESKEELISNFIYGYHVELDETCYNLLINIIYPDIDINTFPTDIIKIIKGYYDDEINISYMMQHSFQNKLTFWINDNKIILLQSYVFSFRINVILVNKFFVYDHNSCYIDTRIIKSTNKYKFDDNIILTDLIAVINYYIEKKYNINDAIPCLSTKFPKITTIKKNYYKCRTVYDEKIIIENIQIVDETLFEVVISIVSELIKCTCEYLKEDCM